MLIWSVKLDSCGVLLLAGRKAFAESSQAGGMERAGVTSVAVPFVS